MSIKSIMLYYTEGGSDKVYQIQLDEAPGGYTVTGFNGRRGSALKAQPKTQAPVTLEQAEKIYADLVKGQAKKGYTTDPSGVPFSGVTENGATAGATMNVVAAQQPSGMPVQLLTDIDEDDLESYLTNPSFVAQEKFDGERRPVRVDGDKAEGGNRKGLLVGLSQSLVDSLTSLGKHMELDAEIVGDQLYLFDALAYNQRDLRGNAYSVRLRALGLVEQAIAEAGIQNLHVAETAHTEEEKRDLLARVRAKGGEGVVFKKIHSSYEPGRSEAQGKFKFYATCSAQVSQINDKRSVGLQMVELADGQNTVMVDVGNVTIPPNKDAPAVGDILEVRYLYAHRGGSLFQPSYLSKRNDLDLMDCDIDRLKYKNEPHKSPRP